MRYVEMTDRSGKTFTVSEGGTINIQMPVILTTDPSSVSTVEGEMTVGYTVRVTRVWDTSGKWRRRWWR